jgi:hypothetical protein
MEALLDMSRTGGNSILTCDHLPGDELRKLHISRGPSDGKIIGISAGLESSRSGDLLHRLSTRLMHTGAALAYGGDFLPDGTLQRLVDAAASLPKDLVEGSDVLFKKRIRNYLGFPSFRRPEVAEKIEN